MRISDWSSDVCSSDLSADDFLSGKVQTRAISVPPSSADCSTDGSGKGALILARGRMESIAVKIRTRAALTPEERQFVGNVRTLPVYRLLEWGVRQGVVDSVIGDTDELVALTLARSDAHTYELQYITRDWF